MLWIGYDIWMETALYKLRNRNLTFGYIKAILNNEELLKKKLYIEVEKKKYLAKILLKPLKESNFKNI